MMFRVLVLYSSLVNPKQRASLVLKGKERVYETSYCEGAIMLLES